LRFLPKTHADCIPLPEQSCCTLMSRRRRSEIFRTKAYEIHVDYMCAICRARSAPLDFASHPSPSLPSHGNQFLSLVWGNKFQRCSISARAFGWPSNEELLRDNHHRLRFVDRQVIITQIAPVVIQSRTRLAAEAAGGGPGRVTFEPNEDTRFQNSRAIEKHPGCALERIF
jgi:hypothetical protein